MSVPSYNMFDYNCNIHNYTRIEAENILKRENKMTAIVRFCERENDIMAKNKTVTSVYAVSRKDLKNNIAHYLLIVYNNKYAILHTDIGPCNNDKHEKLTDVLDGNYDFI